MGQYEKAIEDLETTLKINPEYSKAVMKKGDIYMM